MDTNKTRTQLQTKFYKEKGIECFNSQGEPDIDYVQWLEDLLLIPVPPTTQICDDYDPEMAFPNGNGKCKSCGKYHEEKADYTHSPVEPTTQVSDEIIKEIDLRINKIEADRQEQLIEYANTENYDEHSLLANFITEKAIRIKDLQWMRSQLTSQQAPQQTGKDKELYILREFQKMCNESLSPEMLDMLDKIKERLFLNRRGLK